jgi:hypothetical protein
VTAQDLSGEPMTAPIPVAAQAASPEPIEQAGIYPTMPHHQYHADPALSHSGARLLLDSPARFQWRRTHPDYRDEFDFGSAAHRAVLGAGSEIVVVEADDWRTKAAREARDEARTNGLIPLLRADVDVIEAMRAALHAHPIAGRLFTDGGPEQSMFWPDERTGIMLRARPDWLRNPSGKRDIMPDYKSCQRADVTSFGRSAASNDYHQQAAWYLAGWRALTGRDAAFVFVAQEKEPPYLVNIMELDAEALAIGESRNRRAIDLYAECLERDEWPGYPPEVQTVSLPRWAVIEHEQSQEEITSW